VCRICGQGQGQGQGQGHGQGQGGFVVRGEGGAKFLSAREEKRGGRTEGRQGGTRSVARSIRGSP